MPTAYLHDLPCDPMTLLRTLQRQLELSARREPLPWIHEPSSEPKKRRFERRTNWTAEPSLANMNRVLRDQTRR